VFAPAVFLLLGSLLDVIRGIMCFHQHPSARALSMLVL